MTRPAHAIRKAPAFLHSKHKPTLVPRDFYNASPESVARGMLGKLVVRHYEGQPLVGRITEVEAYQGLDDPAAHASAGRTLRNQVLFGPPGFAYVYFIYGMYYCLNVSCLPEGEPGGVLIRALEPLAGLTTMAELRHISSTNPKLLTGGPGRLCEALGITRAAHNGVDVTLPDSLLQILDDGFTPSQIQATPRIGIRKATDRLLRFLVVG